jgi:hypothetical protein
MVFGVGIVFREGVVELAVEPDDLAADRLQYLRCERARRAVAASTDHFEFSPELRTLGEVGDVACGKILHEDIRAASPQVEPGVEDDLLQPRHLFRPEGERAVGAHLHAGPAIVVV